MLAVVILSKKESSNWRQSFTFYFCGPDRIQKTRRGLSHAVIKTVGEIMKGTTHLDLRKGIHKDKSGVLRLHRYCQEQERGLMVELKC